MRHKQYRAQCKNGAVGNHQNSNSTLARKARTRTLIQAGGLLEKAGLLESFNLKSGDDLQGDYETKDDVKGLFGLIVDMRET